MPDLSFRGLHQLARGVSVRVAVVLIALPLAVEAVWDCNNPVLARPIQQIACGTRFSSDPLCPADASIYEGIGFFSLELALGTYAGLFTIRKSGSNGYVVDVSTCDAVCTALICDG